MIEVARDKDVYLLQFDDKAVIAKTEEEAIDVMTANDVRPCDARNAIIYASRLADDCPTIEYHADRARRHYIIDGVPTPYDIAAWLLREAGLTRKEAAAVLHAYKTAAEIERALNDA